MLIQFPDTLLEVVDLMGKHLHQIRLHIKKKAKKLIFIMFSFILQD